MLLQMTMILLRFNGRWEVLTYRAFADEDAEEDRHVGPRFGLRAHQVEEHGGKWRVWMIEEDRRRLLLCECSSEQEAERMVRTLARYSGQQF